MSEPLGEEAMRVLFHDAHTLTKWQPKPVDDALLRRLIDAVVMAPTSANTLPMRVVFVKSPQAKERLKPTLMPANVEKTMTAPVTAIIAYDSRFYELIPRLYPHNSAFADLFTKPGAEQFTRDHMMRNGSLQGGYLILAARALGLDCGPMSGFDNARVDAEFFPDGRFKSNFLCNLGYGDRSGIRPRAPRLAFDEVASIV